MKKKDISEQETTSEQLSLIIRSRVMTLEGTWLLQNKHIDRVAAITLQPSSLNYLVSVADNNYLIHPEDLGPVMRVEEDLLTYHTLAIRIISSDRFVYNLKFAGSFLPPHTVDSPGDELAKAKETVARNAMEKYQDLFVSIDQGFVIIELLYDEQGNPHDYYIDQANPALERITGFRNITGRRVREFVPEAPDEWFRTLDKITQVRKPARLTIKSKELGDVWYDIYAFPTGDAMSTKLGILFTDITDRIQTEQQLREKQLKLEIAQREARVGIWAYQPDTDQGMASQEWMDLTGYPSSPDAENWSLETFLALVEPDDAPALRHACQSAAARSVVEIEFRIQHPQRGLQWFLMRGAFVPANDAGTGTLMGSIIDITDRKAFEEQKDQFIGIASHELKTPVTSIKAYAEILREFFAGKGESAQSQMVERMANQVDRLTRLINDLLDTTKITSGGLILEPETFDLVKLISDRVDDVQGMTSHPIIFHAKPLPAITGDKGRIGQVLMNLISNAIKYSPPGSDVIISAEQTQSEIIVKIRDFGIGLPSESLDKIFDRFYRVNDKRVSVAQGLGLGLYIASEIMRAHNGTIGVKGKNPGSEFYFTLPLPPHEPKL